MPVHDFQQLLCWQLSQELKLEVFAFIAIPPASRDFKFCDQIRDSAAAAPRDIAEGFGRGRPREFARYLEFALGSLNETKDSLIDAVDRRYVSPALGSRLINLSAAAIRVTKRLWAEKKREPTGRPTADRPQAPSFSITLEELEERRRRKKNKTAQDG